MEAARVAALRGHKVILADANPKLGGTLQVAKRAPNLHILGDLADWLERQVSALGVDVRVGSYMEAEDVLAEKPDALIVATGGMTTGDGRQALIPGELPPGMNLPNVFDPISLITGPSQSFEGKTAVVFDDVGRYDAIASAEYFARSGASVTFVTSLGSFAPKMMGTSRDTESLVRLNRGKFKLLVNYNLIAIEPGFVTIRARGVETTERISADLVAVVTSQVPVRNLFDELRDSVKEVRLIGDALSPRDLLAAMHDGHRCARAI
jgi:NADPH-dependent 2,4-dienoyl-CoA reductase/sulfur reductase-like enzyme